MTFSDLKQAILNNTKRLEICPAFQQALLATDYQSLITAGIDLILWSYQSGIVGDSLINEFPEATLNTNGIYSDGTFTLTNPASDIYIAKSAVVTLNITGDNKCNVFGMGASGISLNLSDNGYASFKAYNNAESTIVLNDDSIIFMEVTHNSVNDITANDNAVVHTFSNGQSQLSYTGNNSSFGYLKAYARATVDIVSLAVTAEVINKSYNGSVINQPSA